MSLIDLILNMAALMLWMRWRSLHAASGSIAPPGMLGSTLRRAETHGRRWPWLVSTCLLVLLRAPIYRQIGEAVDWTPSIPLGAIVLTFRSDLLGRIIIFSVLSFLVTLGIFYASLLLLSVVNHKLPDSNPHQRWVRRHLGFLEIVPWWLKPLLPWFVLASLWLGLSPLLAHLGIVPLAANAQEMVAQAAVVGLGGFLAWKYTIVGILILAIINSYVYLGSNPFWNYLNPTARALVKPVSILPLQWGRLDGGPVVMMVLVFFVSEIGTRGLTRLYAHLSSF